MAIYLIIKTFIWNTMSQIDTYMQDYFDYGLMTKCPNCNSRTILSYPSTVCTKCKNRFINDITAVKVNTYSGHCCVRTNITQYGPANKLINNK